MRGKKEKIDRLTAENQTLRNLTSELVAGGTPAERAIVMSLCAVHDRLGEILRQEQSLQPVRWR